MMIQGDLALSGTSAPQQARPSDAARGSSTTQHSFSEVPTESTPLQQSFKPLASAEKSKQAKGKQAARGGGMRAVRALTPSPKKNSNSGGTGTLASSAGVQPIGLTRAKVWSAEVEESFRLQEAGYKGLPELLALGLGAPERWPETGFIRKLQTRHSLENGGRVLLYFRRRPECEARHVPRVKIYRYAEPEHEQQASSVVSEREKDENDRPLIHGAMVAPSVCSCFKKL